MASRLVGPFGIVVSLALVRPPKTAPLDRAWRVLELLKRRTSASIAQLADEFSVSEMTIRRDLEALETTGQVIRIPGGVRLTRGILAERPYLERVRKNADAKSRIGRLAASRVADGESVVLDSGTTTLHIARHLRKRQCTVFTFSLAALEELAQSTTVRVELTGGVYRASSHDLTGGAVTDSLTAIRADRVFFGAAAVSLRGTVMINDTDGHKALLGAARERVLVVDSEKLGQDALYRFCSLAECDLLITDAGAPAAMLDKLRKLVKVEVAR